MAGGSVPWFLMGVAGVVGLGGASRAEPPHSMAFCRTMPLALSRAGAGRSVTQARPRIPVLAPCLPRYSRASAGIAAAMMAAEVEVRAAPLYYGGMGRFLRAPDVLRNYMEDMQDEIDEDLLPKLEALRSKLRPLQEELDRIQKSYDETENEVFGSQILPVEVKTRPYKAEILRREEELAEREAELAGITSLMEKSMAKYQANGVINVKYSGLGWDTLFPCKMKRSFGWGGDDEVQLTVSGKGNSYELLASWKTGDYAMQPVIVNSEVESDGNTRGLVLSFATPDEGPARLCAVAHWFGETKGDDVEKRRMELIKFLKMDRCALWNPGDDSLGVDPR